MPELVLDRPLHRRCIRPGHAAGPAVGLDAGPGRGAARLAVRAAARPAARARARVWLGTAGWVLAAVLAALCVPAIRRAVLIQPLFRMVKRILPKVSATEQEALDAGTIGFDAELFSGQPDWDKLRAVPPITLTEEEKAFLDGPTNELCRMVNDWTIRHNDKEIPEEIWDFVKKHGFLGMLISKEHGGLGFSPQAQSLILGRIASRSPDVGTIVMVPNSLGPGELIEKYGTPEQKHHYLPRLAKGLEVPCFSLTGPTSGSDAATMRDVGYVTRGMHEGKEVVGIRLSWEKRYITLGPNATLVGLAFRVFDPENLLGGGEDRGITVALVPGRPSRRRDRPPPSALGRGVSERPQLGPGRVHPDRLGDRRREDGGPGLAHADGVPGRRARRSRCRPRPRPAPSRSCATPAPMPASASSSTCPSAGWRAWRSRSRAWSRTPTSTRRRAG